MSRTLFKQHNIVTQMAEAQLISQLKFRVGSLQSALADRQRQLEDLRGIEGQADSKIKGLTKIHNEKVKSLLNSIQMLKKEKASLQGLSKQHKRSKLIQHLNKEILDQDMVIQVLRKYIYDDKGKSQGRKICDDIIVKALTKGPERVRPLTREELRIEIDKLKAAVAQKGNKGGATEGVNFKVKDFGDASQISEASEKSFVNQNQEVFKKLKDAQNQNEGLKIELSTKGKIIEKLKSDVKEKDRMKAELQLLANQLEVSGRKVLAFERLLRETKQNMHLKIGQLYERQLKVEELEMNSKEDGQRIKQAHESTNLLIEEMRQEKEQLRVEFDLLKKENEGLMLEKMSMKNRYDQQNKKIVEIREINTNYKEQLADKVKAMTIELERMSEENTNLTNLLREMEGKYFKQRQQWVEERAKLIQEAAQGKGNVSGEMGASIVEEMDRLRKENRDLKQILEGGTGGSGDNKILLDRLENYRMRLQLYETKGDKNRERQLYDELFDKYNNLLNEYEKLRKMVPGSKLKGKRVNVVEVSALEENRLRDISSGVSQLNLSQIDSDILDNFDSSYEYELRVNQFDTKKFKGVPKMTEEDQQLLKLISSDLWDFVKDDRVGQKIDEAIAVSERQDGIQEQALANRIREIKNISHPQGTKLVVYDSELKEMEGMSDSVSVTSAVQKEIDQYDSDVNIQVKRTIRGTPAHVNLRQLGRVQNSFDSDLNISSAKSGDSNLMRKKKVEKASVIKVPKEKEILSEASSEMNSSVSSVNVNESVLAGMDSDVSVDFRKKKVVKK